MIVPATIMLLAILTGSVIVIAMFLCIMWEHCDAVETDIDRIERYTR
jgi:hypothetical protein